jgi:hypothetical protein
VVVNDAHVNQEVKALRKTYSELQFCFRGGEYADLIQKLHELL